MRNFIVNYKAYSTKGGAPKRKVEVIEIHKGFTSNYSYEAVKLFNGKMDKNNTYFTCDGSFRFDDGCKLLANHGDNVVLNMVYI